MRLRNLTTEFGLAFRYLKPQRNAVSVITCISVLGVTLGVAVLIVVLAVMTGFTDLWKDKILETTSHFRISARPMSFIAGGSDVPYITDPESAKAQIRALIPNVRLAEVVEAQVLVQSGKNFAPKMLICINNADSTNVKVDDLRKSMLSGHRMFANPEEIVVSSSVAKKLGAYPGDKILIHSPARLAKMFKVNEQTQKVEVEKDVEMSLPMEFKVTGLFRFGKHDFDENVLFAALEDGDELLGIPYGTSTVIYGWVDDPFNMKNEIAKLRATFPQYTVQPWEETNAQFLGVLQMEKTMMFFLLIFIVLVAAFSIMNTLITVVMQKTREIGILKSLGATSGMVMRVFVFQGLLVGVIGNLCGVAFGVLMVTYRNDVLRFLNKMFDRDFFPEQFYFFHELPGRIVVEDVAVIVMVSIVLCTLGAVIPAFRAARLDPAKALRYE